MVLKLWCFVIFTVFSLSSCIRSKDDVKYVIFNLSWSSSANYQCSNASLNDIKIGEKFKVHVKYDYADMQEVGRCSKSQESDELVQIAFKKYKSSNYEYLSKNIVNATRAGDWIYKCVFYFKKCTFDESGKCWPKWYGTEVPGLHCSARIKVAEVVEPSGYLTANTMNYTGTDEHIYKFRDGDTTNFTCNMTTGTSISLTYAKVLAGRENVTITKSAYSRSLSMELHTNDNNTILTCIISGDKTKHVIRLNLVVSEEILQDFTIVAIRIALLVVVVLILILIAAGLTILVKKHKNNKKNSLVAHYQNLTTNHQSLRPPSNGPDDEMYAEPYSFSNQKKTEPVHPQSNTNEPTYLNSQQLTEPTYSLAHDGELTYAAVHKIQPNFATVKNSEVNFASVQNSVNKPEENAPHTPNSYYVNLNLIKHHKNKLKSKDRQKDAAKKSPKVDKNKKDKKNKKSSPRSQKPPAVTYAELSLANASPEEVHWNASKVPNYCDVQQLTNIDHDYENAGLKNNSIEPAYCEIISKERN